MIKIVFPMLILTRFLCEPIALIDLKKRGAMEYHIVSHGLINVSNIGFLFILINMIQTMIESTIEIIYLTNSKHLVKINTKKMMKIHLKF